METTNNIPLSASRKRWSRSKTLLLGAAVFSLTLVLFYMVENWRGKRAWDAYKQRLEQNGIYMEYARFIPPEIPAESNVFAANVMSEYIRKEGDGGKLVTQQVIRPPSPTTKGSPPIEPKSYELEVGSLIIVPPAGGQTSAPHQVKVANLAEAYEAIEKHAQPKFYGAKGNTIVGESMLRLEPVQMVLTSPDPHVNKETVERAFQRYKILQPSSNTFSIVLRHAYAAKDYIASTPSIDGELRELVEVLQRPYARLPGEYSDPAYSPVPNYIKIRGTAQLMGEQAHACLLLGQPEEAFRRLEVIHRLRVMLDLRPSNQPATLITVMINTAISGLLAHVIQDGFKMAHWKEPQLAVFPSMCQEIELLPRVLMSMQLELAGVSHQVERKSFSELFDLGEANWKNKFLDLVPEGWTYLNLVNYARFMEAQIRAVERSLPLIDPDQLSATWGELEADLPSRSPFMHVAQIAIPNIRKAILTTAKNQTKLNCVAIASGLERYRSKHHEYPQILSEIAPEFLKEIPRDLIGGGELRYRRTSGNEYVLYSVGWNQVDDGGYVADSPEKGDWVWGGGW